MHLRQVGLSLEQVLSFLTYPDGFWCSLCNIVSQGYSGTTTLLPFTTQPAG